MRASVIGLASGLLGVTVGLAVGLPLGLRIAGDPVAASAAPPGPAATAAAGGEAAAPSREALEAEVARLRAALAAASGPAEPAAATPAQAADPEAGPAVDPYAAAAFDEAALREAGHAEAEIRRLRERWDAFELERLYLIDQARREGWLRSGRFQRENRRLQADLRSTVGDDDFDAMLYAAGQNNRVGVIDVIAGSAGEQAGLQPGDRIVRYDGERIFDMASLVRATADSEPGTTVEIRFSRDGDELRAFVPAGPIGIRLRPERAAPDRLR